MCFLCSTENSLSNYRSECSRTRETRAPPSRLLQARSRSLLPADSLREQQRTVQVLRQYTGITGNTAPLPYRKQIVCWDDCWSQSLLHARVSSRSGDKSVCDKNLFVQNDTTPLLPWLRRIQRATERCKLLTTKKTYTGVYTLVKASTPRNTSTYVCRGRHADTEDDPYPGFRVRRGLRTSMLIEGIRSASLMHDHYGRWTC